ncbi:hypothetical protein QTI33_10885 [Variovorax sp. J22P271]|uniref:hypothetical protein n=1 Tax=Variovorax davisae TaxID=3053515 RepID=UPI002578978D|nr:hypothetical protein [Variovorax sp. J22P271]MDM0032631.1 hypothetical protein [Variovorax sp. J22P271]
MNDNDRALCVATAGLLRASGAIALWGLALALIAGVVLGLTGRSLPAAAWGACAVVGLLGLAERYLALRLRLDMALFEGLAQGTIATLPALDGALDKLGLRRAADATRPLAERVLGTRQLMQRHGIVVAMQTVVFILALVLQD